MYVRMYFTIAGYTHVGIHFCISCIVQDARSYAHTYVLLGFVTCQAHYSFSSRNIVWKISFKWLRTHSIRVTYMSS